MGRGPDIAGVLVMRRRREAVVRRVVEHRQVDAEHEHCQAGRAGEERDARPAR
jgi:hypothetical protein